MPLGENSRGLEWPVPRFLSWCLHKPTGETQLLRVIRIVCTVAHLDHQPENCADDNLRFWCQRDHLRYDRQHHTQTAYRTRREGWAVGDLLEAGS